MGQSHQVTIVLKVREKKDKAITHERGILTENHQNLRFSSRDDILEKAIELVHEVEFQLSKREVGHINEPLKTKSISTPKLLIKYHKNPNTNGEFPIRLVIPEKKPQLLSRK